MSVSVLAEGLLAEGRCHAWLEQQAARPEHQGLLEHRGHIV